MASDIPSMDRATLTESSPSLSLLFGFVTCAITAKARTAYIFLAAATGSLREIIDVLDNSANIKSLKSFLAKITSSNQISQITIDGFTQPTPINPNPLILSKARANSVAKLIKSQGVSAKIIKAGKGNEKVNKPSSRYVLVTVTSTVAG